jgi:hypothetical protein
VSKVISLGIDHWTPAMMESFVALGGNSKANLRVKDTTPSLSMTGAARPVLNAFIVAKWTGAPFDKAAAAASSPHPQATVNAGILTILLKHAKVSSCASGAWKSTDECVSISI